MRVLFNFVTDLFSYSVAGVGEPPGAWNFYNDDFFFDINFKSNGSCIQISIIT